MRQCIVWGAMVLVACRGEKGTGPDGGDGSKGRIVISAISSSMVIGTSQQLRAAVTDSTGKAVQAAAVTWSATSGATVSGAGVLTAAALGPVKVTARSGILRSTVDIVVVANPCTSPLSLRVGDVRSFTGGSTVSCVTLAPTTGASEFLLIGSNVDPAQDQILRYTMSTAGSGVSASIAPAEAMMPWDSGAIGEARDAAREASIHERLRLTERRLVGPLIRSVSRRAAMDRSSSAQADRSMIAAAALPVGDTVTVRVPNLNTGKDICRDHIPVRGVIRAISTRATILEDVNAPAGGFTSSDFTTIAAEFDNLIYPTDTAWFGRPTDINNDGRITILYTPEVNRLTPANSTGFTAGFFFGSDLLRKTDFPANNECRNQTNEQEIFYLLSPDPTGQFNNVRTTVTVRQGTRGVIAHEFQHMINQGVRQFNPAVQALETFWLNEAMSHMAEEAVGRAIRGFGDFQQLGYSAVNPTPSSANDYNAFFRQNLVRFQRWMQRPDTASPVSVRNRDQLAPRGASWALVRYTADHYANGAARAFFRQLAAGPETDITNLRLRAQNVPFDELITGWLTANFVDGGGFGNFATRYTYPSWDIRDVMTQVSNGTFPLQVNTLPGSYNTQALSGSGTYYRLTRAAGAPAVTIRMTASGSTPLTSAHATLVVARLN